MVDSVLYFEGERGHQFRILRGVKNRFGATDEIGVFDMTDQGLMEVPNPSALFLSDRQDDVAGATVFAGIEGTRPVLVKSKRLPHRHWQHPRPLLAGNQSFGRYCCFWGTLDLPSRVMTYILMLLKLPSMNRRGLAVATALVSSLSGVPICQYGRFGEIGLSGEIRAVSHVDAA